VQDASSGFLLAEMICLPTAWWKWPIRLCRAGEIKGCAHDAAHCPLAFITYHTHRWRIVNTRAANQQNDTCNGVNCPKLITQNK
jgi:hypothetical protein